MRSKWVQLFASRATLIVSGLVFVASFLLLPIQDHSSSFVGQWIYDQLHPGYRFFSPRPLDRSSFVHYRGQFVYLDSDQEMPPQYDRSKVFRFTFWHSDWSFGWWAATETEEDMRIEYFNDALELASSEEILETYVEHLVQHYPFVNPFAEELKATARAQRRSIRWLGWFHNAVSLISLFTLLVSAPLVARTMYRSRLSRKGSCSNCRYDRAGLSMDAPCPECGAAMPPSPAAPK